MDSLTTRKIAELLGMFHCSVLIAAKEMLIELGLQPLEYQKFYLNDDNQRRIEYLLPQREGRILVAGLSLNYRAALVDSLLESEGLDNE